MQLTPEIRARPEDPRLPTGASSLTAAVLLAAAVLLVALAVALWLSLNAEREKLIEQAFSSAERSSVRLASRTHEALDRADKAMRVLKSVRENRSPVTLADLSRGGLVGSDVASAFLITDPKGQVEESTSPDVVLNLGDDDAFKRLAREPEDSLVIGEAVEDHIRGGWVIPLMRRIESRQGFDGVVVALLRPASLITGFNEDTSATTVHAILGLDGVIRARLVKDQLTVGGRIRDPSQLIARARAAREKSQSLVSPIDGRLLYVAATQLTDYPLLAVVAPLADDVEAAYAGARDRTLAWGSTAALLLLVGAAMLWQQARQLEASRADARRSKALYEATLEGGLDGVWILDPIFDEAKEVVDLRVGEANERSLQMTRLRREVCVGGRVSEVWPSAVADGLLKLLIRVQTTRQPFHVESPGSAEAVQGRWFHLQAVPAGEGVALIARDITERRQATQQLAERETFMRTLLDALPLAVYAKSARAAHHGEVTFWNQAAEVQYGLSADQVIGKTGSTYLPPALAAQAVLQDTEVARERRVMSFPEMVLESAGHTRYIDFLKAPVLAMDGEVDMILVIAEDVTDQRAAAAELRLVSRVVQETGDAVLLTDRLGRVALANAAFASLTGRALDGLLGLSADEVGLPQLRNTVLAGVEEALRLHRRWAGESLLARADGPPMETWLNVSAITDEVGDTTHYAWLFSDISVLKTQERLLIELSRRDSLTQLSNRRHFEEQLELATARSRRHGQPLALVYLDLDGFKLINDSLGHEAGDRVLIEVGRRLSAAVRSTDLVSRLGGDEFTVILENAGSEADRVLQCQRLLDELSRPHDLDGQLVLATPSIGVAVYQADESIESLRHRADVAMYAAKHAGKGRVEIAEQALAA